MADSGRLIAAIFCSFLDKNAGYQLEIHESAAFISFFRRFSCFIRNYFGYLQS